MEWIDVHKKLPSPGCDVLAITMGGRPTPAYRTPDGEWRISFGWNYMLWSAAYDTLPDFWMESPKKPWESKPEGHQTMGARIKQLRRNRRMTRRKLSVVSGISKAAIKEIELGYIGVSYDNAVRLVGAFGLGISDLKPREKGES